MDAASVASTSASSARRRSRGQALGRAGAAALQQQLQMAQAARHRSDIDWIVQQLETNPELALMVRSFMEAGGQAALSPKDDFPRGVRKLSQLPVRDMSRALVVFTEVDRERLDLLDNFDSDIHNLFFYALGLPKNYPVCTKDRMEYFQQLKLHYINQGERLKDFFWDPDGVTIDWTFGFGRYTLVRGQDRNVDFVKEVWGNRYARLPVTLPSTRLHTFLIEKNWSIKEAKLTGQIFIQGIYSELVLGDLDFTATFQQSTANVPPLADGSAVGDDAVHERAGADGGIREEDAIGEELVLPA